MVANGPPRGLSSSGKRWVSLIAVCVALALPKHVRCGFPAGDACSVIGPTGRSCETYELEPLGFFLVELVAGDNVGFAYERGVDCH